VIILKTVSVNTKAVKCKTVAKVGVATLPPLTLVMGNISPHRCPNPISRVSFLDSTQACFANETLPLCIFNKTLAQLTRQTIKSLLNEFELLQATWWYNA